MAYDLFTKKQTGRDWSCGSDETQTTGQKIAPFMTAAALGLAAWVIYNQPSAREIQEAHLRKWKRGH